MWYRRHGRHDLPWRRTCDPYRIFISELMLQQTQVDRVIPKYTEFLKAFPTIQKLSRASQSNVLKTWHGLGYNRRALYACRAAQKIIGEFRGKFPHDIHDIELLPGVGKYTVRAIRVFAWNTPEVLIETNIRRVFIHFFFSNKSTVADRDILAYIQKTLPRKNPRAWYWALMDYGALALKDVKNPNRKSAHYTRQSRFLGSRRHARAKIISFFLERRNATSLHALASYLQRDTLLKKYAKKRVLSEILRDLKKEGFVVSVNGAWRML